MAMKNEIDSAEIFWTIAIKYNGIHDDQRICIIGEEDCEFSHNKDELFKLLIDCYYVKSHNFIIDRKNHSISLIDDSLGRKYFLIECHKCVEWHSGRRYNVAYPVDETILFQNGFASYPLPYNTPTTVEQIKIARYFI